MAFPTITVKNASNADQTVNTLPPAGQNTAANSLSVVLASDHGPVEVIGRAVVVSNSFNRPADTSSYAVGDLVMNATAAASAIPVAWPVVRANGGTSLIKRARIKNTNANVWNGSTIRLHLFQNSPTMANGDNGVFANNVSDSGYVGYIDVAMDATFSGAVCKGSAASIYGDFLYQANASSQNIYGVAEVRQVISTPAASSTFTIELEAMYIS